MREAVVCSGQRCASLRSHNAGPASHTLGPAQHHEEARGLPRAGLPRMCHAAPVLARLFALCGRKTHLPWPTCSARP